MSRTGPIWTGQRRHLAAAARISDRGAPRRIAAERGDVRADWSALGETGPILHTALRSVRIENGMGRRAFMPEQVVAELREVDVRMLPKVTRIAS